MPLISDLPNEEVIKNRKHPVYRGYEIRSKEGDTLKKYTKLSDAKDYMFKNYDKSIYIQYGQNKLCQ